VPVLDHLTFNQVFAASIKNKGNQVISLDPFFFSLVGKLKAPDRGGQGTSVAGLVDGGTIKSIGTVMDL
jgi:hypothetical protein